MAVIFILICNFEYFTSILCVKSLFFWHLNFENFLKKIIYKKFLEVGLVLADTNLSKNICRKCLGLPLHVCAYVWLVSEKCSLNLTDLFYPLRKIASTLWKRKIIVLNLFSVSKMHSWMTGKKYWNTKHSFE